MLRGAQSHPGTRYFFVQKSIAVHWISKKESALKWFWFLYLPTGSPCKKPGVFQSLHLHRSRWIFPSVEFFRVWRPGKSQVSWRIVGKNHHIHPWKWTNITWKGTILNGISSSNHHFSGDMLVLGGGLGNLNMDSPVKRDSRWKFT